MHKKYLQLSINFFCVQVCLVQKMFLTTWPKNVQPPNSPSHCKNRNSTNQKKRISETGSCHEADIFDKKNWNSNYQFLGGPFLLFEQQTTQNIAKTQLL